MPKIQQKVQDVVDQIVKKYHPERIILFGSVAMGAETFDSDVDILVEFNGSLLKIVRLEREIEDKTRIKVDLLTYQSIHPLLRKRILNEEVRII